MNFNLCDSATALAAANYLSKSRDVFFDVHGRNLGYENGELQILVVATVMRGHEVFLFDVRRIPLNVLMPILDILRSSEIRKIVWNARRANLALQNGYGIQLGYVLDLQLADTASRGNSPWRVAAIDHASHPLHDVRGLDLEGIYPLASFKRALRASDSEFIQRESEGVGLGLGTAALQLGWKDPHLVPRAVTNLATLSRIYCVFLRHGIVKTERGANAALDAASMRYATMDSAPLKPGNQYQMTDILPLEILSAPAAGTKEECTKCRRILSGQSFARTANDLVKPICRVCAVLDARSATRARVSVAIAQDLSSAVLAKPPPPPQLAMMPSPALNTDAVAPGSTQHGHDGQLRVRELNLLESAILRGVLGKTAGDRKSE